MARQLVSGDLLEGKYRIDRLLGQGGMGVVYEAEHVLLKRRCAVKVLHPTEAEDGEMMVRFRVEAQSAANIHHPNIVEVMDFGTTAEDRPFFVMEYLNGESLRDYMDRQEKIRLPAVVEIIDQILAGLNCAHLAGIIHRDLKPDNIFLAHTDKGNHVVKILDFGISKLIDQSVRFRVDGIEKSFHSDRPMTEQGIVLGTPGYMAPESIFGKYKVDGRADLFSVGVLMYEMITGRRPFIGADRREVLIATANGPLVPPSQFRSDLTWPMEQLILIALAKDPAQRFESAKEQLDYLTSAAVGRVPFKARASKTQVDPPSTLRPTMSQHPRTVNGGQNQRAPHAPRSAIPANDLFPAAGQPPLAHQRSPVPPDPVPRKRWFRFRRSRPFLLSISPFTLLVLLAIAAGVYYFGFYQSPFRVAKPPDPIGDRLSALERDRVAGKSNTDPSQTARVQTLETTSPSSAKTVSLWLETKPPQLTATVDGILVTGRPIILKYGTAPVEIIFSAAGYHSLTRRVVPNREQTLKVHLNRLKNR